MMMLSSSNMSEKIIPPPECKTLGEFNCMKLQVLKLSALSSKQCPKYCIQREYSGKLLDKIDLDDHPGYKKWRIQVSDEIDVYEEYLVYDLFGCIGYVGGTVGLFIGFSILELIYLVIDYIAIFFANAK